MNYPLIIIAITVLVSIAAFSNQQLFDKLILWPKKMNSPAEYYRLLTSGFIHANWAHLLFNMLTLYFFGSNLMDMGAAFPVLYLTAIIVASIPTFLKHRNNGSYRSLGASGGVAAVVFFTIYFFPWSKIYFFFIPIGIPSILFAVLYLIYSAYMARTGGRVINHDAHFWGSVYGFVFAIILDPTHGQSFLYQMRHPIL